MTNNVVVNRGDSFALNIVVADDENYIANRLTKYNDFVYLAILFPNQPFEEAVVKLKKSVTQMSEDGIITFVFGPEATLDLTPGTYYYTAKLVRNARLDTEIVGTLIPRAKLIINA